MSIQLSAGLKRSVITAFASVCVLSSFTPVSAFAQQGSAGALLDEIVTTARKKSEAEAVQDVPIAVAAFGADQLEALFVQKIDDLGYLMPNVQMEQIGTFPGVQSFSIRGQGINSSIPSVDPTVGVFIDGVYLGTTFGVVLDTFDLESVEVLRGPQGLLFGRNVTGGAVLVRNARPTGEFGFRARAGVTDDEETVVSVALEGSLSQDVLAAKIVVHHSNDDGYFENPTVGRNVGALETTLVRPTLVWTPNGTTDITLIYENGTTKGDGGPWARASFQMADPTLNFTTDLNDPGVTDIKWNQTTLEVNVDAGPGTLTNILGYRKVEVYSEADVDGSPAPIFFVPGNTDQDQISNELRWSGNFSDTWEATLGLYYFEQDVAYRESRFINLGVPFTRALGGDMNSKNLGLFWNNDIHVGDAWTLTAGLRYTDEEKTAQIITGLCADVVTFACTFDNLKGDWSNVTPKLGAQWHFADNSRLYAYWSKGYRSGGFNFRNAKPNVIPPGPTREEEANTIEVGLKHDFSGGRMRFNIAAFQNKIEDIQREINVGDPDVIVLQATLNTGDVTIKGVEADFVALLTDTFSINASYGWQDGKYTKIDPLVPQIEALLPITVVGGELPRLAPSNYSLGFSWDIPMGNAGLLNVASNYSFREKHFYDDSNSPTALFDDQKRWNASVNWFSANENWQASLYGKNLNDQPNWGNLTSIGGLWIAGPMQKGRVIGLEVNFRM